MKIIGGGCVFQQLTEHWTISDPQTNLLSTLEMKLAHMSMSKEDRRDITKLYNPTTLAEMSKNYPFIDWTKYVNQILTKDTVQVRE